MILIFALLFSLTLISPAFLKIPFPFFQLMRLGDVTDLLTPLILLPLYWLLFTRNSQPSSKHSLVFIILAALLAQGQGMHLSANSIDNLFNMREEGDLFNLIHFFDEFLSHLLWFFGSNGLVALLIFKQLKNPGVKDSLISIIIAAIFYGVTYFITGIESQTVILGIPFAILVSLIGFKNLKNLRNLPLLQFFFLAHVLSLILFLIWFLHFHGFPEFSALGLI